MHISPINVNYNSKNLNNNKRNQKSNRYITNTDTSFCGITSSFVNMFSNKKTLKTKSEVLKKLGSLSSGCYIKMNNVYKNISPSDFKNLEPNTFSEMILKKGKSTSKISSKNKQHSVKYRNGITPYRILQALKNGANKLTMVLDDELHILNLPKEQSYRQKISKKLEKISKTYTNAEDSAIMIEPKSIPDFLFKLSGEMIDKLNIPSANLNKISLKK